MLEREGGGKRWKTTDSADVAAHSGLGEKGSGCLEKCWTRGACKVVSCARNVMVEDSDGR